MNSRYRMIDEMLRTWLTKIDDEVLLEDWERVIRERVKNLKEQRTLSSDQLIEGLRAATFGTLLYAQSPGLMLRGEHTRRTRVAFYQYQPRAKRAWVFAPEIAAKPRREIAAVCTPVRLNDIVRLQLARTEIDVRRRAPHLTEPEPPPQRSAANQDNANYDDSIPF